MNDFYDEIGDVATVLQIFVKIFVHA